MKEQLISKYLPWGIVAYVITGGMNLGTFQGETATTSQYLEARIAQLEVFMNSGDRYSAQDASKDFALYRQELTSKFSSLGLQLNNLQDNNDKQFSILESQLENFSVKLADVVSDSGN